MLDDIIYYSTITASISLGSYYKSIHSIEMKRNYGTGLGILMACLISGHYIYHTILMVWANIIIIRCCDKRHVHQVSLAYTGLHLLYLHIYLMDYEYVIWLHQNMALRLVGMAFEIHSVGAKPQRTMSKVRVIGIGDTEYEAIDPTITDVISYAFFFIGLHKGPYYKWKIFNDHLNGSFGALGDCRVITEQKLKKALVCFGVYVILRLNFSPEIYFDDSFYYYDTDTRYLYNIPLLVMYLLRIQIIMLLCTSACTEAGFGMYPAKCQPLPGHGPSTRHSLLNMSPELALEQEYNFSMLKCFDNEKLLIGPRMNDTLRSWEMPIRYWFWSNIYKNLFRASKEVRNACSFLAWTLWSGPSLQQIIISSTLWVYIHLESEYANFYNTLGPMKLPWDIGFSIMRVFCLIYLTPCFVVKDASVILKYYTSIFWVFHVILLVLIVGAIVTYKSRDI